MGSTKKQRVLPPVYLFAAIVIAAALYLLLPGPKIIGLPWNLLGLIPLALGSALNLIADKAFKEHETTVKPYEESSALITTGAFRVCRHPMYLGFVLIILGIAVLMGSVTPFVVALVLGVVMEIVFIRTEEKMLEETFGDEWRLYKARVRKWV